jgi:hypothetical protein
MRKLLCFATLGLLVGLAGCGSHNAGSADVGESSSISGGTGGEGSGPTGTQGAESAINPAATSPDSNGTGGP